MAGVRREWAAATCGVYAGAWLVGRRDAGMAAQRPMDAKHVAPREPVGTAVLLRMDRRVVGCLGIRTRGVGRGERARRGATRRRAGQRSASKPFQVPYFELDFLNFSKQNCTKA
jgi:hypothetical protein